MARALSWLALMVAYAATLFYIAAMVSPWWYTRYYAVGQSEDSFYANNAGLDPHTGLFHRTNCFIDGSCITGGQIYKNNSSLQWVYTAILVLMLIGWLPWLFFVHLVHFRANKNRTPRAAYRPLLVISAVLTWLIIFAAVLVFGIGMYKTNGVYNAGGLYGKKLVVSQNNFTGIGQDIDNKRQVGSNNFGYTGLARDQNLYFSPVPFGSLPYGNQGYTLLGAGIPLLGGLASTAAYTGDLGYQWGAHAAWYFAIFLLAMIPLTLLLALAFKTEQRVVTTTRTTERVVATQPAVIPAPAMGYQQPAVLPQTTVNRVI
eukprot:TRINITY_DN126_c0_g1_i4.p1 TRINITY_DN126_c0_g1~~TRINITY_DN126_c0_g1_i4.p1  ORF type:complete len:316 (+),score=85.76 TRINITY_DN126_c0_g1_i4:120-1067(+)